MKRFLCKVDLLHVKVDAVPDLSQASCSSTVVKTIFQAPALVSYEDSQDKQTDKTVFNVSDYEWDFGDAEKTLKRPGDLTERYDLKWRTSMRRERHNPAPRIPQEERCRPSPP